MKRKRAMGTINVNGDFAAMNAQQRVRAQRTTVTRKWMAMQTTNVFAEAKSKVTPASRLSELAEYGSAPLRTAVAKNPSAPPATLLYLSEPNLITSAIAQKLVRNPSTPNDALINVCQSVFGTWHGNGIRAKAHPNYRP